MSSNHDTLCMSRVQANINMTVPWFLMACYAYEKLDTPIISDACFDHIGDLIHKRWTEIHHRHADRILNVSDLLWKPSGINVNWDDFPNIIIGATHDLINKL